MVYQWTTLKPTIGKIVRDIRHMDGSYFDDLTEWVAEAIDKLKTHYQLELKCKEVQLEFHHGRLPCAIESLACVVYNNQRMTSSGSTASMSKSLGYRGVEFQTVVTPPGATVAIDSTLGTVQQVSLEALEALPICSYSYRLNYNKIESDLKEGTLKVWYWSVPTDEDGFPMIPKNSNYREAIYFYCRMKMIGTGFQDPVFKYSDCEQRWELNAGRAISEITYPTIDQKQRSMQTNLRLIPTDYLWETAGEGPAPEGDYFY